MCGQTARASQVHRDEPARLDLDVVVAGRQPEIVVRRVVPVQGLLDRLAREVEADARPVTGGLARGVVVDLQDDVGLGGDADTDAVGEAMGIAAGRPEAQFIGLDHGPADRGIARTRGGLVELPRPAGRVDVGDEVVDDAAIPRGVVDRLEEGVLRQVGRQDEAAVDVRAPGGYGEGLVDLEDQVGRAELPALGELGRGRQVLGIAERGAAVGPGGEDGELGRRERLVVLELRPHAPGRLPRRHRPILGHRDDVLGPLPRLLVGLEGERPHLVASVAVLALRLEDRGHVLGEGRDRLRPFRRLLRLRRRLLRRGGLALCGTRRRTRRPGPKPRRPGPVPVSPARVVPSPPRSLIAPLLTI